ncbi:Protein of unknown function [Octadecabacter temperatus]|uniref:Uncharacterized protein n=1 Tax=Octadecabacter temperatus TaxID=1458307 RepID=A0A0K0Y3W8_9RHOB|nr:DUF2484 family protein [Octadecabacter temperatus]AKS45663.1 hypothetical protein OSB_11070 [Octadecabacter temperatus]SIN97858.1 Protein of unknown function [Octadecabacter temperatus]
MMAMGLGFAWLVAANVLALIPSRDNLWTRAYVLIAIGIPLLGYITYTNGPLLGMVFLIAGCSVLRWPVVYLTRWVRRMVTKAES